MKVVVIRDMSAGNESVGEMWKETKIFEHNATLFDVLKWGGRKKNITITIPDGQEVDFEKAD
ncbi:hypothetical protein KAR91_48315 [Candidatus Pacearchaeota archaeon]|nr:hypothetical protein [Candidatus Pacearchaeota archaeon]